MAICPISGHLDKMLGRVDKMPSLVPPEDQSITTLYVGSLTPGITDADLRDAFYPFGEVCSHPTYP